MRTYTLPLTFLFVLNIGLLAQRPWTKCLWPDVGDTPHLQIVSNTLMAYDASTAYSYDHGATWSSQTGIVGQVRGMVDFPFISGSIALTQETSGALVHGFFTQSGSNWTKFDSLDIGARYVTGVATIGIKYFVATNTNEIVIRGTTTSEVSVPTVGTPGVTDIAATPAALAVITSSGMYITTNEGLDWSEVHPDGGVPPSTMPIELSVIAGVIYASSDYGVLMLQESNASLHPVGNWPLEMGIPSVTAVSGDVQNLIALVKVDDHSQMFKLSTTDTAWSASAYPLSGTQPSFSNNMLVVDNGWAVTYHHPDANVPDSVGVFRFDLNDFTDVIEQRSNSQFTINSDQNGLFILDPPATTFRVQLFDLLLRSIFECTVEGGIQSVSLPNWVNGYLCVVVTDPQGRTIRGVVIR